MDLVAVVATALWAMLPAYLPNNVAVVAGGGRPIDGGYTLGGDRLLGDGKTWRGTAAGTLAGGLLGLALDQLAGSVASAIGIPLPGFPIAAVIGLPVGAMGGDLAASFLKRRTGRARGAAAPGLDQLDFVLGALLVSAVVAPGWFAGTFTPPVLLAVLVITPLLHVGTNAIAYLLGIKNEPW
ncbi:MAG: CDP-2,3-bis-(O-geranylgeranyl)-sn-glycerol synthase [Halobacteriaceae archaeon]